MKDVKTSGSLFDTRGGVKQRKPRKTQKVKDKKLPYGFRTVDMFKDISEKLANSKASYDPEKSRAQTLYTSRVNKEYYTNTNVKADQILDTLLKPVLDEKPTNQQAQKQLVERLFKHTDKVRSKNKIRKIDQDIKIEKSMEPSQSQNQPKMNKKPANDSVNNENYYKMYDHQMKLETQRKARMYDMAVHEYMNQKKSLKQAKPCRGSERIVRSKSRQGSIYDRLYDERSISRKSVEPKQRVKTFDEPVYSFNPKINTNAKRMVRNGKISDRLNNDAKERARKHQHKTVSNINKLKKRTQSQNNPKSMSMLLKKFSQEYSDLLFEMPKEKGDSFSFLELNEILQRLGFIPEQQTGDHKETPAGDVWIILGGETQDEVMETSIYHIMCILQNLDAGFIWAG